eukprot:1148091-Pelagomonas_calceolata.AAC.7
MSSPARAGVWGCECARRTKLGIKGRWWFRCPFIASEYVCLCMCVRVCVQLGSLELGGGEDDKPIEWEQWL